MGGGGGGGGEGTLLVVEDVRFSPNVFVFWMRITIDKK